MIRKGEIIIACDPDIRDMYICEALQAAENLSLNIRVRILEPVQYPIQHAVMDREIPSEHPPLMPGSAAMLRFVNRVAPPKTREFYALAGGKTYWSRFERVRAEYERRVRVLLAYQDRHPLGALPKISPEEMEILERHRRREFADTRRSVLC